MSKKCPECLECGNRSHLPGCSFAPMTEEREAFIREHAVQLVRDLEEKVRRQAAVIAQLNQKVRAIEKQKNPPHPDLGPVHYPDIG